MHAGKEGHGTLQYPIFSSFKIGEKWSYLFIFISEAFSSAKIEVFICVLKVAFAHTSSQMMLSFYLPFYFMCEKVKPQALMLPFPLLHLMLN